MGKEETTEQADLGIGLFLFIVAAAVGDCFLDDDSDGQVRTHDDFISQVEAYREHFGKFFGNEESAVCKALTTDFSKWLYRVKALNEGTFSEIMSLHELFKMDSNKKKK